MAIVSTRAAPTRVAVRGDTTRKNAMIRVNGPSQIGVVRKDFPVSFILGHHLDAEERKKKVVVILEKCFGKLITENLEGPRFTVLHANSDVAIKLRCEDESCMGKFIIRAAALLRAWEYRPGTFAYGPAAT